MAATESRWQLQGDYFENCNCDVVCLCLLSVGGPMTAKPTQGACEVGFGVHIDHGRFGDVPLDGLNVAMVARTPGPMAEGNWSLAIYLDERADTGQREALQAIFSGQAGGPVAAFAPLVSTVLGVKSTPITFTKDGKRRAVQIPGTMQLAVNAVPTMKPDGSEAWLSIGHPFAPDKLAAAVGESGSTYADYGMQWDNSGKNGHYAEIAWSNG